MSSGYGKYRKRGTKRYPTSRMVRLNRAYHRLYAFTQTATGWVREQCSAQLVIIHERARDAGYRYEVPA